MPATVRATQIGYGDAGALRTMEEMRRVVNSALRVPTVVEHSHNVVLRIAVRNRTAQAMAIRDWMATYFRFVSDPVGMELLRTPEYMLNQYDIRGVISGDCDDAAILGAAMGKSVGIPAEFVAIGFQDMRLAHIYTDLLPQAGVAGFRVSLDVTKPAQVRAQVRRAVRRSV